MFDIFLKIKEALCEPIYVEGVGDCVLVGVEFLDGREIPVERRRVVHDKALDRDVTIGYVMAVETIREDFAASARTGAMPSDNSVVAWITGFYDGDPSQLGAVDNVSKEVIRRLVSERAIKRPATRQLYADIQISVCSVSFTVRS